MANPLTPDEVVVLGLIIETGNLAISDKRIKAIAKHCNISYDRAFNAIMLLHGKGVIFIPIQGEKNIQKKTFTCKRCGNNYQCIISSFVHSVICPQCLKKDNVIVEKDVESIL